ncbi:MAG: phage holin family protein [Cyanobacteria bacterium P01_D01_bin.73]
MKRFFITWMVSAIALAITAFLVKGIVLNGIAAAIITALLLGIVNAVVRPILFWLTLPLNILTLGLFSLVLNGICLMLVDYLGPEGFQVRGPVAATIGALILAVVSWTLNKLLDQFLSSPESA